MSAPSDGWVLMSEVGMHLKGIGPNFDFHDYCYGNLLSLVKSCSEFEVRENPVWVRQQFAWSRSNRLGNHRR